MPSVDQLMNINTDINNNREYRINALKNIAIPTDSDIDKIPLTERLGLITLNSINRYVYEKPHSSASKPYQIIYDDNKFRIKHSDSQVSQTKRTVTGYNNNAKIYFEPFNGPTTKYVDLDDNFNPKGSYKNGGYIMDAKEFSNNKSIYRYIRIQYEHGDELITYDAKVNFTIYNTAIWYQSNTSNIYYHVPNSIPFYTWYIDNDDKLWLAVRISIPNMRSGYISGWIKTDNSKNKLAISISLDKKYALAATAENVPPTGGAQENVDDDSLWIAKNFDNPNFSDNAAYFDALYSNPTWSMKSFKSVIGLPFHFMHNVDQLVGTAAYGKQFIEDILYDMPIVCLRPGGPVMNSSISGSSDSDNGLLTTCAKLVTAYQQYVKDKDSFAKLMLGNDEEFGGTDEGILEAVVRKLFIGKYSRFYTFSSDYQKYVEYVNTLCHVFIEFLDIGNLEYTRADNTKSNYSKYQDTWELMEDDQGNTMKLLNGPNMAIYGYYQPESQIGESFSNSTTTSSLAETMKSASSSMKQATFMLGVGGINNMSDTSFLSNLSSGIAQLSSLGSSGIIGRLFSAVGEGIGTVIGGNNIDLPEIYDDSSTSGGEETLIFKLVSPYGDRESIFLYILRPLARLMAMSLPRQFGPNSYRSPFLVQAFSKGHFNIQCGIVTNLSIRRGGNGGESHTINNIPTELEVTMTIKDMYGLVTLSNEYLGATGPISALNPFGAMTASRLLFNNIGLIDFCASYCGYNLNSPEQDTAMTLLMSMWANRISDNLESPLTGYGHFKSPKWNRTLSDAFYDAVTRLFTFING